MVWSGVHQCKYCQKYTCCSNSDLISAYRELVKTLDELCEARINSYYNKNGTGVITQVISVKCRRDEVSRLENGGK